MRTIKFRVWDTLREKFIENRVGEYVSIAMGYGFSSLCIDSNELVLQQYTGLIDKNGKEIYEGDVVISDLDHISYKMEEDLKTYKGATIKFFNGAFKVCEKYIGARDLYDFTFMCECCPCGLEIIGNIFENPELLK